MLSAVFLLLSNNMDGTCSNVVENITYSKVRDAALTEDERLTYSCYDDGNIRKTDHKKKDADGNFVTYSTDYVYDALGQLVCVNDQEEGKTRVYTYNAGFNMTSEKVYAYTTAAVPGGSYTERTFVYDSVWKDQLDYIRINNLTSTVGNPVAVVYNNAEYYYMKNIQGDIVGLVDWTGAWVVEYRYDAWGKILSTTGSLASTLGAVNPLRYRGYYYDVETGFYYVSSRYYDPEVGRFISPDTTDILEVQDDLYDKNLYAYCDNNPVMRVDLSGAVWHLAVGAVVGIATQFIADVGIGLATGSSFGEIMSSLSPVDYVSAAVGGAIAASGIGTVGAVVANAALGGTTYLANCSYKGVEANTNDFVASTIIGGAAGAIGGSGANGKNMRGVYSRSKQVINATKSARKQTMYKAKITTIKKNVTKSSIKTVVAGLFSNVGNFVRKLFSGSIA